MPELIDTHVHLDDPRLKSRLADVLAFASQNKVGKMINIGHDLSSSIASVALANEHAAIWAAVGIHPHSASSLNQDSRGELRKLAGSPKVVAIGEVGLDYHYDLSPRRVQRQAFEVQLDLAIELNLPVVVHQREAVADTLSILAAHGPRLRGGVIHCFMESLATLDRCLDLGFHIGLGGAVTFRNALQVKEVARTLPLERLVLETDCPYMAPHPQRGKVNQPGYLPLVAAEISRLRGIETDHLIASCSDNARKLFGI